MDGSRWQPLKQPCPNDTLLIDVLFLHETGADAAWFIDLVPVCLMGHTAVQTSVAQTLGSVLRISSLIHVGRWMSALSFATERPRSRWETARAITQMCIMSSMRLESDLALREDSLTRAATGLAVKHTA